jgi:hypothetical protein
MHPIHRKRVLKGGFIGPLVTGLLTSVAPQIFSKIFGNGKRRKGMKGGKKRRARGTSRIKKAFGELINSGPLP